MWPNPGSQTPPSEDDIQVMIAKAKETLDTPEGRERLEAMMRVTRAHTAKMLRESYIDPAILKEPMTI